MPQREICYYLGKSKPYKIDTGKYLNGIFTKTGEREITHVAKIFIRNGKFVVSFDGDAAYFHSLQSAKNNLTRSTGCKWRWEIIYR